LSHVSDDVWQSFEATDILPQYQDNMFVSKEDALKVIIV